ncbi:DUF3048 domain-containing protein [Patescibacteria group bacterium]|nr:DUF3048 domain-containing protein [Patescibacteria group bacterium]MCL5409735.1 DUF3048 domain-containing protein [Patescibacteria group bacterium]
MLNLGKLFSSLSSLQRSLVVSIIALVLFFTSAGLSYSVFSKNSPLSSATDNSPLPGPSQVITEDPSQPKTESCPLNGSMHTKQARDNWSTRLPLAVMIENHPDARPQSGLSSADIVYEAVAEGGITRFMAIYLCNLGEAQVGPVRSARTYFIDWLSEYDAVYAHVGGANTPGPADALSQIVKYDIKDLNQFSIGFPTYWRDYQRLGRNVATEHTMYSTTAKLWDVAAKKGYVAADSEGNKWSDTFVPWKFKDDNKNTPAGSAIADKIDVTFWQGYSDFNVTWQFDGTCDCYKRFNGGAPHIDLDNNQQLTAKNVVVQFEKESRANDGYENNEHLLYKTIGSGKALIFQDGKVIEGTWNKASRTDRTIYKDSQGKEIAFNRGVIWIQTVPEGAKVDY